MRFIPLTAWLHSDVYTGLLTHHRPQKKNMSLLHPTGHKHGTRVVPCPGACVRCPVQLGTRSTLCSPCHIPWAATTSPQRQIAALRQPCCGMQMMWRPGNVHSQREADGKAGCRRTCWDFSSGELLHLFLEKLLIS